MESYEEKFERLNEAVSKLNDIHYYDNSIIVENISPYIFYEWVKEEFFNYTLKNCYTFTPNELTESRYYSRYEGDEGAILFIINAFYSDITIMNLNEEEYKELIEIESEE